MEDLEFDYDAVDMPVALTTGTLVSLLGSIAGNVAGSRGVVYQHVVDNGISYASDRLENGHDIGAFASGEAKTSLSCIGIRPLNYEFVSPAQLQRDYVAGVFATCFDQTQR